MSAANSAASPSRPAQHVDKVVERALNVQRASLHTRELEVTRVWRRAAVPDHQPASGNCI